jgi:hypothetical protein
MTAWFFIVRVQTCYSVLVCMIAPLERGASLPASVAAMHEMKKLTPHVNEHGELYIFRRLC